MKLIVSQSGVMTFEKITAPYLTSGWYVSFGRTETGLSISTYHGVDSNCNRKVIPPRFTNCRVRSDMLKLLCLSPPRLKTFQMTFNRPNLHYEVCYKSANEDPYLAIVKLID